MHLPMTAELVHHVHRMLLTPVHQEDASSNVGMMLLLACNQWERIND